MHRKFVWQLLMLLIPFAAVAQVVPPVLENFSVKTQKMRSFMLDNNVSIVTTILDNNITQITAINDRMQILWRTNLVGYGLATGVFKDKVFAVTASEHSARNGTSNNYGGFLLDRSNGKVLVNKVIYDGDKVKEEIPVFVSAKDGSFLKLIVRQTDREAKQSIGDLYARAYGFKKSGLKETKVINVIEYDENLFQKSPYSLTLNKGTLFDVDCNYTGNIYLSWYKDNGLVEVEKFEPGKAVRSAMVSVPFDVRDNYKAENFDDNITVLTSTADQNVVYLAAAHETKEKDTQLSISKVNFANNTQQMSTEKIDRNVLKQLEKAYVPFDKKMDDPDLGNKNNIAVRYMDESNGDLVVSMSGQYTRASQINSAGYWINTNSPIVSVYGSDLKLKMRQLIPANYVGTNATVMAPPVVYFISGGRLYFIANAKTGMASAAGLYGVMDLKTGQYLRQQYLSKKNIKNATYVDNGVMWFGNSFIVPYAALSGMFQLKFDFTLQLNGY